jgi:hypothetical protein
MSLGKCQTTSGEIGFSLLRPTSAATCVATSISTSRTWHRGGLELRRTHWILATCIGAALHALPAAGQFDPLAPTPIIEYYNSDLGHYFITSPGEAAMIDAGSAGPGWGRTGRYFTVEPLAYPFYGRMVCRFYGSVHPGPNSHFFTLDPVECEYLKHLQTITPADQPRWNFEGMAFPAGVPQNGACLTAPYRKAVYRLYNNGWARGIESNHRFIVDPNEVAAMIAAGWLFEGVGFCALDGHPSQ